VLLLFCRDPLARGQPDPAFAPEVAEANSLGLPHALIDFEVLTHDGDAVRAVRAVPEHDEPVLGLFRGWMLRPPQYARLYAALSDRSVRLINDPAAYQLCHYLPACYERIASWTPRTVWLPLAPGSGAPPGEVLQSVLAPFGDRSIIVKDYVKSRKHEWAEACFIPSAAEIGGVERVVRRFLELQGDDLEGGLVFREHVAFVPLGAHSRSGMPLTREYRIFWLDGEPIFTAPYWDEGDYDGSQPPAGAFRAAAEKIASRFFTMDVAQRVDNGAWQIIELGDAQVAGVPARADLGQFYEALTGRLH
jgi:hypothetical protein